MQSWVKKYEPRSLHDIEGQDKALLQLSDFASSYDKQVKKALLLYGPSGCGKTCSVYAMANDLGLELLEVNASDFRNKDKIQSIIGPSMKQRSIFGKDKLILVDEIDGLSGSKDRGGAAALNSLINSSVFPIVLTANDPWKSSLSSLRKRCVAVQMHALNYLTITKILKRICDAEGISREELALKTLARRAGGDLRGAINDLQTACKGSKSLTRESIESISGRLKLESMPSALIKVLKSTDPLVARSAFDNVAEDLDASLLWLEENVPKEYEGEDLARAFDCLSRADVFRGRILRWQYWRFLVYVNDLMTAGVALSKDEKYKKFVQYRPTTRILKLWKAKQANAKRKAIAEKLAKKTHSSVKETIKSTLPYLKMICRKSEWREMIASEFNLEKEELAWLSA